jgi:hypothetical protein
MYSVMRTSHPKSFILHGYSRENLDSYPLLRVCSLLRLYLCGVSSVPASILLHPASSQHDEVCSSKNGVGSNEVPLLDYFICRKYDWMK